MKPYIVGIGGALRPGSSTEKALRVTLAAARQNGAETCLITGADLDLPMYAPESPARSRQAIHLVDELRRSDGVILASPGYHGCMSGLIKNVLDYVEDLRVGERTYLEHRSVGLLVTAGGPQASVTTLSSLRAVVHSLRGWSTPLGVTINTSESIFDDDGRCIDQAVQDNLETLASEVVWFATHMARSSDR